MFLVMASGVPVDFLKGPHNSRHEDRPHMMCCDDFFEVYIRSSSFRLQGFRKGAVLVLGDTKAEGGKKNSKHFNSCSQILEETRLDKMFKTINRA